MRRSVLISSEDSKLLSEFQQFASELCLTVPALWLFAKERLEGPIHFPTIGRSYSIYGHCEYPQNLPEKGQVHGKERYLKISAAGFRRDA